MGFIDSRKAFDSVWHEALLLKLGKSGTQGSFYKVLKSMYSAIKCSVKYNDTHQSE